MRSAHTAARGIMIAMNVAIMTAIEDLHQVAEERDERADLRSCPSAIRCAPNHSTATLDALNTSITVGNISACSLPTRQRGRGERRRWRRRTARVSTGSRTNARTTRMPVICSRSTRLTRVDPRLHEPELRHHPAR